MSAGSSPSRRRAPLMVLIGLTVFPVVPLIAWKLLASAADKANGIAGPQTEFVVNWVLAILLIGLALLGFGWLRARPR